MKLPRRHFLHLAAGAAALPAASRIAMAQTYPTRPVHLIAGYPAGGVVDLMARLIGEWLSERLGQSFVVENHAGAGSNLATEDVIHALPDGYTLLECSSSNAWNVALYDNLKFDFIRDIAPVASIYQGFAVLVVRPSFPAETLPEFITFVKANPGKLRMASGGVGTAANCSKRWPAWTCCTYHTVVAGRHLPTFLAGTLMSCSIRSLHQLNTFELANFEH
jgi:tripartite-type tricarboxylate transporter receptor subunit TctC